MLRFVAQARREDSAISSSSVISSSFQYFISSRSHSSLGTHTNRTGSWAS